MVKGESVKCFKCDYKTITKRDPVLLSRKELSGKTGETERILALRQEIWSVSQTVQDREIKIS